MSIFLLKVQLEHIFLWNTAAEGEPLSVFFMVKRRAAHLRHSHFENAVLLTSLEILMPKKYSITESYVLHFQIPFLFLLLQTPRSQIRQRRFNLSECNSGECDGPFIGPRYQCFTEGILLSVYRDTASIATSEAPEVIRKSMGPGLNGMLARN